MTELEKVSEVWIDPDGWKRRDVIEQDKAQFDANVARQGKHQWGKMIHKTWSL